MKRFIFTLARILDYRQSLLEKEKNNLMVLFTRRTAIEQQLERYGVQHAQAAQELTDTAQAGTTVVRLQQIGLRVDAAQYSAERSRQELAEQEQRIERQREVIKALQQDVKGLEKLRDKQREEYDYGQRKEEEERIAELVASKLIRQQVGAEN